MKCIVFLLYILFAFSTVTVAQQLEGRICDQCAQGEFNHKSPIANIIDFYKDIYKNLAANKPSNTPCTDINPADQKSLINRKYVNQSIGQFCASFAMADVLSNLLQKPISGIDIVISSARTSNLVSEKEFVLSEHSIGDIVNAVNKYGVCPDSEYDIPKFGPIDGYEALIPTLIEIQKMLENKDKSKETEFIETILKTGFFKNLTDPNVIRDALTGRPSFSEFIFNVAQKNCHDKRETRFQVAVNSESMPFFKQGKLDLLNSLRKDLVGKSVPLLGLVSESGNHAVSLVGMKNVNGQCQYWVRDSNSPNKDGLVLLSEEQMFDSVKLVYRFSKFK